MISKFNTTFAKWSVAVLALTLVIGCSSLNKPSNQDTLASKNQSQTNNSTSSESRGIDNPNNATTLEQLEKQYVAT